MDNNNKPPEDLLEALQRIRLLEQQAQLKDQQIQRSEQRAQRSEQQIQRSKQKINRLRQALGTVPPSSLAQGETAVSSLASHGTDFLATGTTVGFATDVFPTDTTVGSATDVWSTGTNLGVAASPGEEVLWTVLNRAAAAVATDDTLRGTERTNILSTGSNKTVTTVVSIEVPAAAEE